MTTSGNGIPPQERDAVPPPPRNPAYDRLQALRKSDAEPAARPAPTPAKVAASEPVRDFMGRVDNAAAMLADVGAELGHVGEDDAQGLRQFADTMRDNTRRYIGALVERKRRELADLERILGKL